MHQTMAVQQRPRKPFRWTCRAGWRDVGTLGFVVMTQPDRAPSPLRRARGCCCTGRLGCGAALPRHVGDLPLVHPAHPRALAWRSGGRRVVHPVPTWVSSCHCWFVAAVALVTFIGVVLATESLIVLTVGLGLAAVSVVAASYALSPISAEVDDSKPAPWAHHPVLPTNLR